MLKLDDVRLLEGHQIHGDDDPGRSNVFYVMPRYPRIARLETGGLALRFVEYDAIRRQGESQFGGFVAFDTDLSFLPGTMDLIRKGLQDELDHRFRPFGGDALKPDIQTVPWLRGAVKLLLQQDGKIVEKLSGSTVPSLTGYNTACFFLELTVLGTAIFKETLSRGTASAIQVIYDLDHYVRLPQSHAWGHWHADSFYSFFQDVDTEDNFWSEDSYTEITNSTRYKNEVTETHFDLVADPGLTGEQQAEFDAAMRASIMSQLDAAVQRNLLEAVQAVDPNVKGWTEDQDIEDVHREISTTQISDVRVEWTEAKAVIRTIHPQGMLPTVTSLQDTNGAALRWEDYYSRISVDEFLRSLLVSVRVDADFPGYGITLVEVKIRYPHGENAKTVEATFTKDDAGTPQKAEFIVADKIRTFFWSYTVNFTGDTPPWTSPEVEDDGTDLNVKVHDLPVLKLDVVNGDINFEQVARARVRVRYEGGEHPVERFFNLTEQDGTHQLLEVIGEPRAGDVTYQTTYTMKGDGREITGPELRTDASTISVDDPFRALRTVTFQAVGDLTDDIDDVTVQAVYEEPANTYRRDFAVTLSGTGKPFDVWTFPTVDEAQGKLSYTATVRHRDGTSEDVEVTDAKGTRFELGRKFVDKLDVAIVPDLLDWTKLKLVNVSLKYLHSTPPKTDDFLFRSGDTGARTWSVFLPKGEPASYSYSATFFLLDGSKKTDAKDDATEESLFLDLPA
ncbi:hypothetical protein [Kineococcus rhizosphaerae]|uniref:Uncharacterized protein n=1 Tax=Kineococcus rhizosphaerae TaxID=559628 RepID=A0A2T0R8B1_9ACTN|nr:hypothetical protein [Kineococcus rhizosphaerae]PRY17413.1 hypothetical protein CLV37_102376 [Kineococcus rhizosphaerae]